MGELKLMLKKVTYQTWIFLVLATMVVSQFARAEDATSAPPAAAAPVSHGTGQTPVGCNGINGATVPASGDGVHVPAPAPAMEAQQGGS